MQLSMPLGMRCGLVVEHLSAINQLLYGPKQKSEVQSLQVSLGYKIFVSDLAACTAARAACGMSLRLHSCMIFLSVELWEWLPPVLNAGVQRGREPALGPVGVSEPGCHPSACSLSTFTVRTDIDKVMINLKTEEFVLDMNTLQALQQLLQWVGDFVLYLLVSLPNQVEPRPCLRSSPVPAFISVSSTTLLCSCLPGGVGGAEE